MSTWLITGCSTGLGRHLAKAVLERGHNAIVTARDAATIRDLAETYPESALALSLGSEASASPKKGAAPVSVDWWRFRRRRLAHEMETIAARCWALAAGCAAISAFLTIKATIGPFIRTLRAPRISRFSRRIPQ